MSQVSRTAAGSAFRRPQQLVWRRLLFATCMVLLRFGSSVVLLKFFCRLVGLALRSNPKCCLGAFVASNLGLSFNLGLSSGFT